MVDRGSQVRPLLFSAGELVIELARAASSQSVIDDLPPSLHQVTDYSRYYLYGSRSSTRRGARTRFECNAQVPKATTGSTVQYPYSKYHIVPM